MSFGTNMKSRDMYSVRDSAAAMRIAQVIRSCIDFDSATYAIPCIVKLLEYLCAVAFSRCINDCVALVFCIGSTPFVVLFSSMLDGMLEGM